jgi:hypothetical protein
MPTLARIQIFPVKSLDPQLVETAEVLPCGALRHDRQWALFDAAGRVVNAKMTPRIQLLRSECDPEARTLTLRPQGECQPVTFHLDQQRDALEAWLVVWFGHPVFVREDSAGGFPDDMEAPGPTVISTETLQTVASWFAPLTELEIRRRFRANLEISADEPFWEDHLFADEGELVRFRIGSVEFGGTNPCQRCPVPTRDSHTGEPTPKFHRDFIEARIRTLPDWANRSRFDHFYRLAVNTRLISRAEGVLRVGDVLEIV